MPKARRTTTPEPAKEGISQRELSERLGLTTRQLRNLTEEGMPRTVRAGKVEYPWPASLHWYIERVRTTAKASANDAKANVWTRKAELEIKLTELEVAKAQGQVITIDYAAAQWERALFLLRARAVAAPERWMDEFVGLPDAKAARKRLDDLIAELLTTLSDAGDDESFDDIVETEAEDDEPAPLLSA